jgi:phosphatidylinositol alpha-1,6-mannosyltransferase
MRALVLTENFPPVVGGTPRWFWELYRRVPRSEVLIAAGAHAGHEEFDRSHDLRIERLPLSFPDCGILGVEAWKRYRTAEAKVRLLMRRERLDVAHCGRLVPEGWIALRSRSPYACFVHGEELNAYATSRQLTWMARRVLRHATGLIANSDHTARILVERWQSPRNDIRVLRPGVDAHHFVPAARDPTVRTALGWGERPVVLTVGRLQKRKGHDRMIEAVGSLRQRFPDLLYAVAGDGSERRALAELAARLGVSDHVRFHGEVDDGTLLGAYQQCDLFALPHRRVDGDFEGFGMVLLEAQACGRAVIAGDSGGSAEAVRIDETGLIVDCSRADVLGEAVAQLLGDETRRQEMGRAGRRWVEGNFDFGARAAAAAEALGFGAR